MAADSIDVGVVLERRDTDNEWIDHAWHFVGVLPGARPNPQWTELASGEGWVRYHVANLPVEIFSGETEGYKYNLSLDPPVVFVVLDPEPDSDNEDGEEYEIAASLVTVCPYEAQDYLDVSENEVQSIPMPPAMVGWLTDFVDKHHVDEPFKKRKRKLHPDKKPAIDERPVNELIMPGAGPKRNGHG